jgi:uncharacterized membrane protein YcaP (DUF421 family)|tara:strand:+ start:135 stop:425 length:291 start_codon:yes stop_codon:yes gene_type:complete
MSNQQGIQQIREVLEAVLSEKGLVGLFLKSFKDGAQADDAVMIFSDLMSNPLYMKAIKDISKVKMEMKDLDLNEGFVLAQDVLAYTQDIIRMATDE